MCIDTFVIIKPMLEQIMMETIHGQIALINDNKFDFKIHYQRLLELEEQCQALTGKEYTYHEIVEEELK